MNTDMTTTPAPAGGPLILVPGAPSECKECGSTSVSWFASTRIRNNVPQGRLRTNDTECVFVLGCDECSETLHVAKADMIAELLATAHTGHQQKQGTATASAAPAVARDLDLPARGDALNEASATSQPLVLSAPAWPGYPDQSKIPADWKRLDLDRQPATEAPMEMRICELRHVAVKPNRPYIFTVDVNCTNCRADAAYALGSPEQVINLGQTFQAGVAEWMGQCFLPSLYSNMTERGDRLLEEVLELLQAHGYDPSRVATLVAYVFGRPVGEPLQEAGGVMVTLAAYCTVAGLDMQAAGDAELVRINLPEVMAKIRAKQEAKNALHFDTPLPGDAAAPAQAADPGR